MQEAFINSLNSDNNIRNEATVFIESAKLQPGFLKAALELTFCDDAQINLAASI
jgi:hypothetical protein